MIPNSISPLPSCILYSLASAVLLKGCRGTERVHLHRWMKAILIPLFQVQTPRPQSVFLGREVRDPTYHQASLCPLAPAFPLCGDAQSADADHLGGNGHMTVHKAGRLDGLLARCFSFFFFLSQDSHLDLNRWNSLTSPTGHSLCGSLRP